MASSEKASIGTPLVIVMMVALAGLGGWWYYANRPKETAVPAAITAEGKAYVRNLKLSDVDMKATEAFTGAAVVEIIGKITNNGDRTLGRVELNCVFYDPYGQVVLRERVAIVRTPMKPGETKSFRLPFEGIPNSWNQALPQLVIASISFS